MPIIEAISSQVSPYQPFLNQESTCTQSCPQKLGNGILEASALKVKKGRLNS